MLVTCVQGIATLPNGSTVDLMRVQYLLNKQFQATGDNQMADASVELSKLSGMQQNPYGDWVTVEGLEAS